MFNKKEHRTKIRQKNKQLTTNKQSRCNNIQTTQKLNIQTITRCEQVTVQNGNPTSTTKEHRYERRGHCLQSENTNIILTRRETTTNNISSPETQHRTEIRQIYTQQLTNKYLFM